MPEVNDELKNHIINYEPDSCICDYELCWFNVGGWCQAPTLEEKEKNCEIFGEKK